LRACGHTERTEQTLFDDQLAERDRLISDKDRLLTEKDEEIRYLREQLAQALKTPRVVNDNRTTNNNQRYTVNQSVNVFGRESIDHITDEQLQRLLQEPSTAVAKLVRLKHSVPENQNVRVPNKRERRYEVVVAEEEGGAKRWKSVDKAEVLEQLWDTNGLLLENEADEGDGGTGARFVRHQEYVKASADSDGRIYRDQLEQIHNTLTDEFR
jgi:hypothetical protein